MRLFGKKEPEAKPKKAKHPVEVGTSQAVRNNLVESVRSGTFTRIMRGLPASTRDGFDKSEFSDYYDVEKNELQIRIVMRHRSGWGRYFTYTITPEDFSQYSLGRLVQNASEQLASEIVGSLSAYALERAGVTAATEAQEDADCADALGAEEQADEDDIFPEWED